ncbi:hypothetical protein B5807_06796 [Epicoccum nigrum]|uniref:Uncharacterized protein n=1 Tax=Epicoccum nigrum TaxID=105696 RepID=A0A1Y2LYF3_EPING|nr:hypothetical protein B5807_06796 [Epicoccum nigrum]
MVLSAVTAGKDPQYGVRFIFGVPVVHGVARGWIPRRLIQTNPPTPRSDPRYNPEWVRTASKNALLHRDLDCEIEGRKNLEAHCVKLEAHCVKLEAQLADKHSQETDEVSQSLAACADQSGGMIQKTADDDIEGQAVNDSFRPNELEPKQTSQDESGGTSQDTTVTANDNTAEKAASASHSPKQLKNTITELKKRLREAEEGTRSAEEDARAAKKQKLETEHRLTAEKKNMTKLMGLAQKFEPRLRPHLHGQPVVDPSSNDDWALFGWLEQVLDNVTDWYVRGGAASLVEDDLKSHFPFNHDPNPGPEPSPYDLRVGPTVLTNFLDSGKSLPNWKTATPDALPKIPNTGSITKDANGKNLSKCKGNTDWSTGETALYLVNRAEPNMTWMLNPAGKPILRWDTPSRTRSRTLESWQSLPKEAVFFKASDKEDLATKSSVGPAWTHYSLAARHGGRSFIMPWANKTCECKNGRYSGNCRPHDFKLNWEDKTLPFPSDMIPESITGGRN